MHDALEGLRFIRRTPVLLGAISLDLFAVLFGGAIALLPAIADERLGVGAVGLGWLRAAGGIGAAGGDPRPGAAAAHPPGGPHAARRRRGLRRGHHGPRCDDAATWSPSSPCWCCRAPTPSACSSAPRSSPSSPRPASGDGCWRSRTSSSAASNELGAFESGVAGQLLGPSGAIVLGGAATLAIAGGWWFLFPGLRNVDRFPGNDDT